MQTILEVILAMLVAVSGAGQSDAAPQANGDGPEGLADHLVAIAAMVAANVEAAAERAAAAEAHAGAIMDWTACVSANAAARAEEAIPKVEPFDPKEGCGDKPTPPDGALEDEEADTEAVDSAGGPPEGTPQGPPEGTPQGPPEGTPQGPPSP